MMSTFLPFPSILSLVDVPMGVSIFLTCAIINLFNRSLLYLLWLMKMSSLVCLVCNHAHFKLILHVFCKFLTKRFVIMNIISSTYICTIKIPLPFLFVKRVVSILSQLESFSIRKDFNIYIKLLVLVLNHIKLF